MSGSRILEVIAKSSDSSLWQAHRKKIEELYENNTLNDVMQIMRRDHGFSATPKQYKSQLSKWRLRKNIPREDMRRFAKHYLQRKKEGKSTEFKIRGKSVSWHQLQRFLRKHGALEDNGSETSSPSSNETVCSTSILSSLTCCDDESLDLCPDGGGLFPFQFETPGFKYDFEPLASCFSSDSFLVFDPLGSQISELLKRTLRAIRQFAIQTLRVNNSTLPFAEKTHLYASNNPAYMLLRCSHSPYTCDCLPYGLLTNGNAFQPGGGGYIAPDASKTFALSSIIQVGHLRTTERFVESLALRKYRTPSAIFLTLRSLANLTLSYLHAGHPQHEILHEFTQKVPCSVDWNDKFLKHALGIGQEDPGPVSPISFRYSVRSYSFHSESDEKTFKRINISDSTSWSGLNPKEIQPTLANGGLDSKELMRLTWFRREELSNPSTATKWVLCKMLGLLAMLESFRELDEVGLHTIPSQYVKSAPIPEPWAVIKQDIMEDIAPVAHILLTTDIDALVYSKLGQRVYIPPDELALGDFN